MDQNKQPRGKALLASAEGKVCIKCGRGNGEVCARHYNGQRQHQYGKGRGIKCHPLATAELCHNCDSVFSEGVKSGMSDDERSEEWLHWIMMTNIRRFDSGEL